MPNLQIFLRMRNLSLVQNQFALYK